MANFRVTAPYILLQVKDRAGKGQVTGFYAGAIVLDPVDDERFQKAVDREWVEPVDEPVVEPSVEESTPDSGTGAGDASQAASGEGGDKPTKPSTADPKAAWVDYAVAQGLDREQAESMTKADLVELAK